MQITMWFAADFQPQATPRFRLAVALLIATVVHALFLILVRIDLSGFGVRDTQYLIEITLLAEEQGIDLDTADLHDEEVDSLTPLIAPDTKITNATNCACRTTR